MRVAVVQTELAWCAPEANRAMAVGAVGRAAAAGADVVLLPETLTTGFATDRAHEVSERAGGPTETALVEAAARHGCWVGATYFETPDDDPRPYNTFLLVAPDGAVHRYRKIHRFGFGGETEHVRAGRDPMVVDIAGVRTALFVCYDLRFADHWWALASSVDVYLLPANWPATRREHWRTLVRARAIENQAYVVACNRIGEGGGIAYAGDSMIVDPLGELVADAGAAPTTIVGEVDPARVRAVRSEFPFLDDR